MTYDFLVLVETVDGSSKGSYFTYSWGAQAFKGSGEEKIKILC